MPLVGDSSLPPQCACRNGPMILRCAGQSSQHPGRYYYICPKNIRHGKHFSWYDDIHKRPYPSSDSNNERNEVKFRSRSTEDVNDNSTCHSLHSSARLPSTSTLVSASGGPSDLMLWVFFGIVIIFLCVVLVLLGVLLGLSM